MNSRSRFQGIVLPAAMIAVLAASSLLAVRGAFRMRDLEERTLRDFALLAGANYAGRAFSMLANSAPSIILAAGKRGARAPDEDLRQVVAALDSLRTCCEAILPAKGVATGVWSDSSSIRFHPRAIQDSARAATLRGVVTWPPASNAYVRFATGGPSDRPFLYLIYPQYDGARKPAGFIAVELDLRVAADSTFGVLFRQRPMLLPERMVGVADNPALGEFILIDRGDRELFRSATPHPPDYAATGFFGRDTTLRFNFQLSSATARALMRGSIPGAGSQTQIVFAVLSFIMAVAIAITLRRAQRLARVRSEFAASVTHELRTPLTQILVSAETLQLQRERSADERGAFLSAIVGESRRLVHLIDNVLHFSRAERRVLTVRPKPERIDALVSQALAHRTGFTYEAPAPVNAVVDAGAFGLALSNVLDNAVQHGGTPARVSVARTGTGAEVIVEDSGPGIPPGDRRRVLEPFVRLSAAEARHPTGSGIGLAVVTEVMRAMHGDVILEDAIPRGLRVRLVLPA